MKRRASKLQSQQRLNLTMTSPSNSDWRTVSPDWTEGECCQLKELAPHHTALELAGILNRSRAAIYRKAFWLGIGLKKQPRKSPPKATPEGRAAGGKKSAALNAITRKETRLTKQMVDDYAAAKTAQAQIEVRQAYLNDMRHLQRRREILEQE